MTDQSNLILIGNELRESVEQRPCSFQYRRPTRSAARFVDSPTLDSVTFRAMDRKLVSHVLQTPRIMKKKPETADLLDIVSSRHLAGWRQSLAWYGCRT